MGTALLVESAKELAAIGKELGVFEEIKKKLIKQPDIAAMKLAAVLEELQKSLLALDTEIVRFLSITLGPGPALRADRATLYALEGQALRVRIESARGHCSKIRNIYKVYLDPWFQRVTELDPIERDKLANIFVQLSDDDFNMVRFLVQTSQWLGDTASSVLDLFEQGKIEDANAAISAARKQLLPVRRALVENLARLLTLEADFIEMSGVS